MGLVNVGVIVCVIITLITSLHAPSVYVIVTPPLSVLFGSKTPVLLFILPAPLGETVQVPAPAPPVCVKVTGGADWQMVVGPFSTIVGQAQFMVIVC
ncbi:MAG: hypothetical protein IPG48_05140 [Saprospiraceae bacterium]|nr:hypothetical protein [Saprospiraceae bacterium]